VEEARSSVPVWFGKSRRGNPRNLAGVLVEQDNRV
jgi:hypothetical protein